MRVRLERIGERVWLRLPEGVAKTPGFSPGSEVDLVLDADRGLLLVRPAGAPAPRPAPVDETFSQAVDRFIGDYQEVLGQLAGSGGSR